MVGDRADAMLEAMDEGMNEARHEGKYRRIEVIAGRHQRPVAVARPNGSGKTTTSVRDHRCRRGLFPSKFDYRS